MIMMIVIIIVIKIIIISIIIIIRILNEFYHLCFLWLLKQQRERYEKFGPERGNRTRGAPPVELLGQLGAGRHLGRL